MSRTVPYSDVHKFTFGLLLMGRHTTDLRSLEELIRPETSSPNLSSEYRLRLSENKVLWMIFEPKKIINNETKKIPQGRGLESILLSNYC
jgi:hypothetical protein